MISTSTLFRPLVVVGPSGVGKVGFFLIIEFQGTLIKRCFEKYVDKFSFSVSYTTRGPRDGEEDGIHYHFTDNDNFNKIIDEDGFIEHCDVHGKKYGTAIKELDRIKGEKKIPVLDIDVQGAQKVHDRGIKSLFIFVKPVDTEDIEEIK